MVTCQKIEENEIRKQELKVINDNRNNIKNRICLIVIDGWGMSPSHASLFPSLSSNSQNHAHAINANQRTQLKSAIMEMEITSGNAVLQANTPFMDQLLDSYPNTLLYAHGLSVGLPDGLMGNSEVGHLNIGAGRIVYQDIVRIEQMIENGELEQILLSFMPNDCKKIDNQDIQSSKKIRTNQDKIIDSDLVDNDNVSTDNKEKKMIHLIGLVSDGGVHSHINHLMALIKIMKKKNLDYRIHMITDGRDTSPAIADKFANQLESFSSFGHSHSVSDSSSNPSSIFNVDSPIHENKAKIASVMGRYWAMDRDKRWDRTKMAYEAMTMGIGEKIDSSTSISQIIRSKREEDKNNNDGNEKETDEFIKPLISNIHNGTIGSKDVVIFFNFRSDRMRQLVQMFLDDNKKEDENQDGNDDKIEKNKSKNERILISMTCYKSDFPIKVLSLPQVMRNVLSEWLSKKNLKQFHCAETEKYAHVTFFFNGGREEAYEGEDRLLIPSPKVATYDLYPEMSCAQVGKSVQDAIEKKRKNKEKGKVNCNCECKCDFKHECKCEHECNHECKCKYEHEYDFVMCNLAPPDMVGHTGKLKETIKAVEATDNVIGEIWEKCKKEKWTLIITSDHGNAEMMIKDNKAHTAHTTFPVPLIICSTNDENEAIKRNIILRNGGSLSNVAPTILELMGLEKPIEMTETSLLCQKSF